MLDDYLVDKVGEDVELVPQRGDFLLLAVQAFRRF